MAEDVSDKLSEGKLDLVPMIDCIMLLLLFFILTTKFSALDLAVASLLPTDKGGRIDPHSTPVPLPTQIDIRVYPDGMSQGYQPSEYRIQLQDLIHRSGIYIPNADMCIGGDDPMTIPGAPLNADKSARQDQVVTAIHAYIFSSLSRREKPGAGSRTEQDPVVIHCFSGLSWKFALVVYDAVRAYEQQKGGSRLSTNATEVVPVREITFAPHPLPTSSGQDAGGELYEIINMK